jgi:outer membrane protein OmpA-like peptidoglycan-associated protein
MRILAIAAAGLALSACATDPNTGQTIYGNTARGAAIGALGGAAVGVLAGVGVGRYMDQQEAELRKATTTSGVTLVRNGNQIELRMPADITFAKNSADIQPQFYPVLNDVATILTRYPKTTIDVVGHASTEGSDSYNMQLSEQRSQSFAGYLRSQGVQPVRIAAYGRGESQPLIAPEQSEADRAVNRRVQVILNPVVE